MKLEPSGDEIEVVVEQWRKWLGDKQLAASTVRRDERCLNYLVNALKPGTSMSTVDAPTLQDAIERIEQGHGNEMPRRALRIAR